MEIDRTGATLGAIVHGVRLAQIGDIAFDSTWKAIEDAWHQHAVLVFPEQHLTSEEQLAFSKRLGRMERGLVQSSTRLLGHLSNTNRDGTVAAPESLQVRFNEGNLHWHSDSSYKRVGAKASLLSARRVPGTGGETEWADMRAAYDALESAMQEWLADKLAVHSYEYSHAWHGGLELLSAEDLARLGPVEHALVKEHPVTGRKSLFVGRHASHVVGEDIATSRELLKRLTEEACQPPRTFKHRWRVGDLVLWDNRCVLHRGHRFPSEQARDMVRSTVAGDASDNEWADAAPV